MTTTSVVSSNLREVGYDDTTETVFVTFHSGATWRYFDVPYDVYLAMLDAPSVGSFFCRNIKGKFNALPCDLQDVPN